MKVRALLLLAAALASACAGGDSSTGRVRTAADLTIDDTVNPGEEDALFLGAGDIARCGRDLRNAWATGDLIRALIGRYPGAKVFTAGDNAYEDGTAAEFTDCYDQTWGSFNEQTAPAPGNHDYHTANAVPYFDYFELYRTDPAAKSRGYYSFDLKDWHIVSLNSNIPMESGSAQVAWLDNDLQSTNKRCILAFWHHPLFSSGRHGSQSHDPGRRTGELWRTLERHDADVILNGHDHDYERFQAQDSTGSPSSAGIVEFVVGTGGAELRRFSRIQANSAHRDRRHGILVLTLAPSSYTWAFLGTDGRAYDRSTSPVECHD